MWNVDCFRRVASSVGNLVEINEANLAWECLEYARLKVRSVVSFKIDMHKDIMINNMLCQVSVIEETASDIYDVYRNWWRKREPSDSFSSMDTVVGDNIQVDEEGWQNADDPFLFYSDLLLEQVSKGDNVLNYSYDDCRKMQIVNCVNDTRIDRGQNCIGEPENVWGSDGMPYLGIEKR